MFTNIEPDALDFICSRDSSHSAIGNSELKEVSCSTVEERESESIAREYRVHGRLSVIGWRDGVESMLSADSYLP